MLGRYEEAARELTAAARLDLRVAATLSHLAYAEAKLNRVDAARMHANAALVRDPNDTLPQQLLAPLR